MVYLFPSMMPGMKLLKEQLSKCDDFNLEEGDHGGHVRLGEVEEDLGRGSTDRPIGQVAEHWEPESTQLIDLSV